MIQKGSTFPLSPAITLKLTVITLLLFNGSSVRETHPSNEKCEWGSSGAHTYIIHWILRLEDNHSGARLLDHKGKRSWNCSRALTGLNQTLVNGPGTREQNVLPSIGRYHTGPSVPDLTILRLGWDELHANSRTQRTGGELPDRGSRSKVSVACKILILRHRRRWLLCQPDTRVFSRDGLVLSSSCICDILFGSTAGALILQLISLSANLCSGCKSAGIEEKHEGK